MKQVFPGAVGDGDSAKRGQADTGAREASLERHEVLDGSRHSVAGALADDPTLIHRLAGVVVQPRRTFDRVVADPRWRGVLLASTLTAALVGGSVMSTAIGRQALVDEWERTAWAAGHEVDDAGYRQLETLSGYGAAYAATGALIGGPIVALAVAGLLQLAYGRGPVRPSFGGALAVTAHAGVILGLRQVVAAGFTYARETTATALSIGAAFPSLDASSPVARTLGFIDVFVLWWVVLLAIGAARLYERRARPTALALVGIYLSLAVLTAAAFAAAGTTV
jgi:hypothetical protein